MCKSELWNLKPLKCRIAAAVWRKSRDVICEVSGTRFYMKYPRVRHIHVNKFYYKVASCWLFFLSHTTMHGSMNIKFKISCVILCHTGVMECNTGIAICERHIEVLSCVAYVRVRKVLPYVLPYGKENCLCGFMFFKQMKFFDGLRKHQTLY
jgi:hypothetical protein